jgi:hypothetical protein
MEIELEQMDQARDICSMALLKYYAGIDHLETEYYNWIYKEAAAFIDRGMVMPFFKKFAGFGDVPYELVDLTYVAYRTNPKNQVTIHFSLSECTDDEICHEPMHHIIGGIFVKAFRLFKDETLTYSITVTDENGEQVVERQTVQAENDSERPLKTGMDHLNRMLEYLSDNDTSKLDEALVAYDRLDVITDQLFKLK